MTATCLGSRFDEGKAAHFFQETQMRAGGFAFTMVHYGAMAATSFYTQREFESAFIPVRKAFYQGMVNLFHMAAIKLTVKFPVSVGRERQQ
jgi:hypothetical protein